MEPQLRNLESLKDTGNQAFKDGKLVDAERMYLEVIEAIEYLSEPPEFFATYMAAINNLCAVYLKLEKYDLVCEYSTKSLSKDDKNLKAYYRRALARKFLQEYEEALVDVESILQCESQNKQALELKTSITQIQSQNQNARNYLNGVPKLVKTFQEPKLEKEEVVAENRTFSYKGKAAGGEYGNGFMAADWVPTNISKANEQVNAHDSEAEKAAALQSIASIQNAVNKYNAQNVRVLSKLGTKKKEIQADPLVSPIKTPTSMAQALAQAKLHKKTSSAGSNRNPDIAKDADVVASVFISLQEDEQMKKQTFLERVQRKKKAKTKPVSSQKGLDGDKLHNKPNRYADVAVSAWDALAEEEQGKITYLNEIIEEKNKVKNKLSAK